jgi:uncharacterized membrane protein YgcG
MSALPCTRRRTVLKLPAALLLALMLFILLPPRADAAGQERIVSYNSEITINSDSSMVVRETIVVVSTGDQIKRGIYRDFPTRYKDRLGSSYNVGFDVESVLRDGKIEEYTIESLSNGRRVRIGNKDRILPPGRYTYTIQYRTDRQLGFFKDHDELYWNVTGNGWAFPIEKASAVVNLPSGVPYGAVETDGYTGPQGAAGKDFDIIINSIGTVEFVSTRPLGVNEGLTIVVGWPKGFVQEPTGSDRLSWFLKVNLGRMTGAACLLLLLIYYLISWWVVGRDPEKGTIIPLYDPPEGLSPAALRYIRRMGYDQKVFASAIINMAVKGYLWIDEAYGKYTLFKQNSSIDVLSSEERAAAEQSGLETFGRLDIRNTNHTAIKSAIDSLKESLKSAYGRDYFVNNRGWFWGGLIFTVISLAAMGFLAEGGFTSFMMPAVMGVVPVIAVITLFSTFKNTPAEKGCIRAFIIIFAIFFCGPFLAISFLTAGGNFLILLEAIAMGVINAKFFTLLKAHTKQGRRLTDKIEGFRMYLSTAEKDRMNFVNPPERTPQLFERYLPYALALDVQQQWAEQFTSVLSAAQNDGTYYYPMWYRGTRWNPYNMGGFADSFGSSFASAVSSSSSPPGSSSGFGGGSSGGGGGGGGGGGW